jgi:transcriptional antiterminator RfaH
MIDSDWLVVMTKPRMETEAKEHLAAQLIEVYLPLWKELKRRKGAWQTTISAMFPRYLFVRKSYRDQSLSSIRSTRGVSRLVHFGKDPAWASDKLINDIRNFEASQLNYLDQLKPFKKGDRVIVLDGPFKGVSAEVFSSDQERVLLMLQVLGDNQKIEFSTGICQIC